MFLQSKIKYKPPVQSLNILWKKESNSDLFIDIFSEKAYKISLDQVEQQIKTEKERGTWNVNNNEGSSYNREIGKEEYSRNNYIVAMRSFNTALKYSENGSKEEALAYANRSACFLRLGMPGECLADIILAKKSEYPEHLMPKLDERSKQCISLLESEQFKIERFTSIEPKLDFNEHGEFAGVANCLEQRINDTFGRHIITTEDLKIGQTILVEPPFSIFRTDEIHSFVRNRCSHCLRDYRNFITCKKCICGIFCNKDCMEASFHKFLCFTHISNPSNHLTFELVIKTICKANTIFPDVDFFMETVEHFLEGQHIDTPNAGQKDFFSIFRLVHNHDKLSKSQLKTIPLTTALTFATLMQFPEFNKKFVTTKHLRFLQHLILHLFHIAEHHLKLFQRKSKDDGKVSFSDFEMYALGMYPFACNINHSCVPNVSYYGNGASLVCKVIRPIGKGDQIFISYRLGVPTFEKVLISAMEKQCGTEYHFKCECIICSTDFFLPTKYEIDFTNTKLYKDIMEANSMTIQAFRKLPREKLKYYEECAIKFLERYDRFHPINETIDVWRILITIWLLFTTRFH